jgi:hypothetical protein
MTLWSYTTLTDLPQADLRGEIPSIWKETSVFHDGLGEHPDAFSAQVVSRRRDTPTPANARSSSLSP